MTHPVAATRYTSKLQKKDCASFILAGSAEFAASKYPTVVDGLSYITLFASVALC